MEMTKFKVEDDPGFKNITRELVRWTRKLGGSNLSEIGTVQANQERLGVEFTQRKQG
jgi:hypothetical protein